MKKHVSFLFAKPATAFAVALLFALSACSGNVETGVDTNDGPGGWHGDSDGEQPSDGTNNDEGPSGPFDPGVDLPSDDDLEVIVSPVTTCDAGCASDEVCTQGGHCVNVTGERDATAALQADFDALNDAVGVGVPYKLPDNAILQLNDLTGDGVALRIKTPVLLDGAGSLFRVQNDTTAIRLEPTAERSLLRDFRIDPRSSPGTNTSIGIDVRAFGVRLDNILFWRIGTGVRAYSELDGVSTNLNMQQWSRLVFRSVHFASIDLQGEVNHSTFKGLEVIGAAGILDGSTKGNTYVAATMEGTHTHSMILSSPTAHHTVMGTYLEEGDPLIQSASDMDLHVGGNSIGRIIGPAERVGGLESYLTFRSPDSGLLVTIPGDENSAIGWKHPQEDDWWHLRYATSQQRWGISHQNTGVAPFFWTSGEHTQGPANLMFD